MILYPTETLYALGVNALDPEELAKLHELKGREATKVSSWLVSDISDIMTYAELSDTARIIAEHFLPGQLTLVLPTLESVPREVVSPDGTIGFRISSDPIAIHLVGAHMEEQGTPLTCTSANVSGAPTFSTVDEILQQFGPKADMITQVLDDGPRKGLASTVVRVIGDEVVVLREGEISEKEIQECLKEG